MSLLAVEDLSVRFTTPDGIVPAVERVSLAIEPGERIGIVGESGSGKSQLFLALLGLLARNGRATGRALFAGRDLLALPNAALNAIRGSDIAMVFQNPMSCLNPYLTIGTQLAEVLTTHKGASEAEARRRSAAMLARIGIAEPERRLAAYPHEFSGGMRQRAVIAIAMANDPDVIIADEPTTALDVTVQAQVLETLTKARETTGAAMVLITHDLGVVAGQADRVLVMYAGRPVEVGTVDDIFYTPRMPYTLGLLGSLPRVDERNQDRLTPIVGVPPSLINMPPGCPFSARCPMVQEICLREEPALLPTTSPDHVAACHFSDTLDGVAPGDLFKATSADDVLPGLGAGLGTEESGATA
jgi:oligopeptide/dipeptide ABC transporter ATP-binding protein